MARPLRRTIAAVCLAILAAGCSAGTMPPALTGGTGAPLGYAADTLVAAQNLPPDPTPPAEAGTREAERDDPVVEVNGMAGAPPLDPLMETRDPFEPINRGFHEFNQTVDVVLARPLSDLYVVLLPEFVRAGLGNGLLNLEHPQFFANYVLQGRPGRASEMLMRFILNSTFGLGGLVDVAGEMGLEAEPTDFGVTLATYGVPNGAYVVTPFLGPSTTRDSVGRVVDTGFSITFYAGIFSESSAATAAGVGTQVLEVVDVRAENDDLVENVIYASPDSYTTEKSIYLQRRQARIRAADPDLMADDLDRAALPEIP